jgi:hypothetical protein
MNMRDLTDTELLRAVDRSNPEVKELTQRYDARLNELADIAFRLSLIREEIRVGNSDNAMEQLKDLRAEILDE